MTITVPNITIFHLSKLANIDARAGFNLFQVPPTVVAKFPSDVQIWVAGF
jgi:hypothetical protein